MNRRVLSLALLGLAGCGSGDTGVCVERESGEREYYPGRSGFRVGEEWINIYRNELIASLHVVTRSRDVQRVYVTDAGSCVPDLVDP